MDKIRILLQTTIAHTADDWHVQRFSLLADHLSSAQGGSGARFDVTARNLERVAGGAADPILASLGGSPFDELWLFGVDPGDGLSALELAGIESFRERGGGILTARDHQDLGCSLNALPGIGAAHHFHTKNPDPLLDRRCADDTESGDIRWPNYHSGRNGDFQRVSAVSPSHPLIRSTLNDSGVVEQFPAHPHEGSVGAPPGVEGVEVVASGRSKITGRAFNLVVAHDPTIHGAPLGRWIAESSFHHLADYNWDVSRGSPSFVSESPGDQIAKDARLLNDVRTYAVNAAVWLSRRH